MISCEKYAIKNYRTLINDLGEDFFLLEKEVINLTEEVIEVEEDISDVINEISFNK